MQKKYYVVECANLLAFENYQEACDYCELCFDNFYTPQIFERENIQYYSEEYKGVLIVKYLGGNKLLQVGYAPLLLL